VDQWLSAFLNSAFFMIVGAVVVYVGMSYMFPKRRLAHVFVAYMLIKGLLWSLYDASYVLGTAGALEQLFQVVGTPILGALSYVVLYYTWEGDFYKIGLGGFILDIITSASMTPVFLLADQLFPPLAPLDYRGGLGLATLFRCGGMAALNLLFLSIAKPLFRWFGSYEFVHKNAWQVVVIASIALATLPRMASGVQVARPVLVALAFAGFLLIPFGAYMVSRVRAERKRKALLESEVKLAEEYVISIRKQLPLLEESAAQLNVVAEEVARVKRGVEDESLEDQVMKLSTVCNQLRYGVYSDSPVLDVTLVASARDFEEMGMRVEYHIAPLGDQAVRAAMVSQTMLSWALDSCKAARRQDTRPFGVSHAETAGKNGDAQVEFRIIREGDQLAFVLNAPSNRRRNLPKRLLVERVPAFDGVVHETDDGARKVVRVLALEGHDARLASAS